MRKFIFTALFTAFCIVAKAHIGSWHAYMAYNDITDIKKGGNNLYVLASQNLYYYNTNDNSIHTFDRTNGLNDCNIDFIEWCQKAKKLVIIYENGNIDLLTYNDDIENISDYKDKMFTGNKTINDVYIHEQFAYVSTGFGIVKLNVKNSEISDTYNLGFNVNYTYIENNNIYAASEGSGIYSASLTSNLMDPRSWSVTSEYVKKNKTIDPELLSVAKELKPGGPKYNYFAYLKVLDNTLYSCGGYFISGVIDLERKGTIQVLKDNDWQVYQDNISQITGYQYFDINCVDVDPLDNSRLFAGARVGLYEFNNGELKSYFNKDNSILDGALSGQTVLNNNYVLINGVKFDKEGNLWILNSQTKNNSIIKYDRQGNMTSFHKKELMTGDYSMPNMSKPFFDSRGLLWFVNNHWGTPALVCYDTENDKVNVITEFNNQDEKNVGVILGIRCAEEDRNGNIWVCTDAGPLMLEKSRIGESNPRFIQVKVPRNDGTNLADYLLAGLDITAMAIDKGGRKWFGTGTDGVYLISEDNMTQIKHFTATNSKLLSNNIMSIAINHNTGEVFFGTDKGLCSYISDATEPNEEMTKSNVYAYPNPVTPDYTGKITITGLSYSADVKILTVNGTLVASGTSNGGTFQWDGNDMNGRRVASGVYNVVTAKEDGSTGTVCKVAVIN